MPSANHQVGESFAVQFAWKLPDGDYIRAVFEAVVLGYVRAADKYVVRLNQLIAGRQENPDGVLRSRESFSRNYWKMVGDIIGRKITVAFEVEDGRAVHMRLATLTGEHNFFARYEEAEEYLKSISSGTGD